MGVPIVLTDEQIAEQLADLPGWERKGDEITRTYEITPPWQPSSPSPTGQGASSTTRTSTCGSTTCGQPSPPTTQATALTAADFDLAHRIDAIVAAHQSLPLD